MRTTLFVLYIIVFFSGCSNSKSYDPDNGNTDVFFTEKNVPTGLQTANKSAKTHYDLVRAAKTARQGYNYDEAIRLLNEALPSAKFTFEKGAVYLEIAELYALKNDLKNEIKYRLLLAEHSGKEVRHQALNRADELKKALNT